MMVSAPATHVLVVSLGERRRKWRKPWICATTGRKWRNYTKCSLLINNYGAIREIAPLCATSCAMPKQVPEAELADILKAVAGFPQPASLVEIAGKLSRSLARRTLQRRLARLVTEKQLVALSSRAGQRYRSAGATAVTKLSSLAATDPDIRVRLSAAAKEIQRLLEQGENAEGKGAKETQMILNHKAAIELLADPATENRFQSLYALQPARVARGKFAT
jgi:hypothetical protein